MLIFAILTVGHPFDTIKVRLQTTSACQFAGPLQCLTYTVRNEGLSGLYKGATPPLVAGVFSKSPFFPSDPRQLCLEP